MCIVVTCSTGGLCSVVEAATVVWTVVPCLMMVVGGTGRGSRDAPGACRTAVDTEGGVTHMNLCKWISLGLGNMIIYIVITIKNDYQKYVSISFLPYKLCLYLFIWIILL